VRLWGERSKPNQTQQQRAGVAKGNEGALNPQGGGRKEEKGGRSGEIKATERKGGESFV